MADALPPLGRRTSWKPKAAADHYQPLVIVTVAVCAGIVADRLSGLPAPIWWTMAAGTWVFWLGCWRRHWNRFASVAMLLATAACGAGWHHCCWSLFRQDDLAVSARQVKRPICLEAVALGSFRRQVAPSASPLRGVAWEDRFRTEVRVLRVRNGSTWQDASGRARLLIGNPAPTIQAGDRLRIFAHFAAVPSPLNPGEFDRAAHARADRSPSILSVKFPECVSVAQPAGWRSPAAWLDALRSGGNRLLSRSLNSREAGLASAVLLGTREEVTAEQSDAMMQTGTIHILSISGMHVAILAGLMFALIRPLPMPRAMAAGLVALATILYALLTDAEPPAVRATILVLVMCLAWALGRRSLGMNSLAAAALAILALNPADLFRTGVQLSFLCVIALNWFALRRRPATERSSGLARLLAQQRSWLAQKLLAVAAAFWNATLLGMVIWAVTIPLIMARFHLLSVSGLFLNPFLWLPMVAALWSGLGVLLLGWIGPLAIGLGWCCDRSLAILEWGIDLGQRMPGSHFWVSGPSDWWLVGFYGFLGMITLFPRLEPPRRWSVALLAAWIGVGLGWHALATRATDRMTCEFVAVDHGCAVVVQFPSGQTILYDAGQFGAPDRAVRSISAVLWSRNISRLEAIVLSHADTDHYNAVPGLLDRFPVGAVYVSPVMFELENAGLKELRSAIDRHRVPIRQVFAGDRLRVGEGCLAEVLHPPRRGCLGSDNANSVVLALEYCGRRVLLTGDLEPPGLYDITAEEPWHSDVLLAPHHGSRRSDPRRLVQWATPSWVVISAGGRTDPRPAIAAYQAHGGRVLETNRHGAVRMIATAKRLRVHSFLASGLERADEEDAPPDASAW